jgi:actin-related protein
MVKDEKIPEKGAKITCKICKHVFKIQKQQKKLIPKSYEKDTHSLEPVIVFTPDNQTIKQLKKLLQKTKLQATFFNSLKDIQHYLKLDQQAVDHAYTDVTSFHNAIGNYPSYVPQHYNQASPNVYYQNQYHDIRQTTPQSHSVSSQNGYFQDNTTSFQQNNQIRDLHSEHYQPNSDQSLNAQNEFDFNRKKRAKVISETIYRQFDTPLGSAEDGPLIEDTVARHVSKMKGPMGLDIGTSHIVIAGNANNRLTYKTDLNAFFAVPATEVTKKTLTAKSVPFFVRDKKIYVCGYSAQNFANIFNTSLRRPIDKGLLSPKEEDGFTVIRAILEKLVPKAEKENVEIAFTIPGSPQNVVGAVTYHSSVIMKYLKEFGYKPIPVNEGFATVISELADDAYTGIGISMGGGMCNVCLSYMAVPIITYSIQKGGDYIDEMVSKSVGESTSKVKMIKEEHLNLNQPSKGRISTAFSIFYDELIAMVIDSFSQILDTSSKIPRISKPLPIVVSGGTAMPEGFETRFANALSSKPLPLRISEVRIAEEPLYTTAKGAMTMAISGGDIYPGGNNG